MIEADTYLIWSNEHKGWWGPGGNGYVSRVDEAGYYTQDMAIDICFEAMIGRREEQPLKEIPVRYYDVKFMLQRFAGAYPGRDPEPQSRKAVP